MADRYKIEFTRRAYAHLKAFRRSDRNLILDAVREQLAQTPDEETRNRKLLREDPLADFELRVGDYRVFYDIYVDRCIVRILAVGVKDRNKLIIGGKEVVL
jgi:mRNA-degrading endonuclease RelE of RelBE toxin-antitoxin system